MELPCWKASQWKCDGKTETTCCLWNKSFQIYQIAGYRLHLSMYKASVSWWSILISCCKAAKCKPAIQKLYRTLKALESIWWRPWWTTYYQISSWMDLSTFPLLPPGCVRAQSWRLVLTDNALLESLNAWSWHFLLHFCACLYRVSRNSRCSRSR